MKSPFARKWPACVPWAAFAAGPVLDPEFLAADALPYIRTLGWFDVGQAVIVSLGVGLLAWGLYRKKRQELEQYSAQRIREATSLIEQADGLLWEAEVELTPHDWRWQLKVNNSALCRKLYGERRPATGAELWSNFRIDCLAEMDRRCRDAMENGLRGYAQEFRIEGEGLSLWLNEKVSITPLGPKRFWLVGLVTDITQRKEAEAARQQSELTVERILQHAHCMLWRAKVVQKEGRLDWQHFDIPKSQVSDLLFGERPYSPERGFWESLTMPEQAEMDERSSKAILSGAPGYEQEFHAIDKKGRRYRLYERVTIVRAAENVWSLVGVVTDVTSLHEAEVAKGKSEARLSLLLERADTMIWQAQVRRDSSGALLWSMYIPQSQLYRRIFRAEPVIPLGFAWKEHGVPEHAEMGQRAEEAIIGGATGYEQTFHVPGPEGDIWLMEKATIVPTSPGQWDLVGIISDITARHLAEEASQASQSRLSKLLELADCMIWEATAVIQPDETLTWDFYTPRSELHRRIFGDNASMYLEWGRLNVPEREAMHRRAYEAVKGRRGGYTQEFHVIQQHRVIWLREEVAIVQLSENKSRLVGVITDITAQRKAEAAQQQSDQRLAALLDRADCMIWQGEVRRVAPEEFTWNLFTPNSQLYRRLFKAEPTGNCHFFWGEAVPEFAEMRQRSRSALVQGLPGYEQVFHYQMPAGDIWLNEKVSIKALGADHWELVGIITDITGQHSAESARLVSEARLQELLTRADCLLWEGIVDLKDSNWSWEFKVQPSLLCQKLYGAPQPRPEVGLWRLFLIPENEEMNARCRSALMEGRAGYEQVFHIVKADKSEVWISESVTIRQLSENRFSLVGVAFDITPMRQAEEALAAEKERLAVTLRAMNECVITTDMAGIIQYMNPAAAALTGWQVNEVSGQSVAGICRLQSARTDLPVELPIARVARGDEVVDLPAQTRLLTRSGGRRQIEGCCAPIHAADSKVVGMVMVFRDVTEQELLEQELVRATRLESVGVLAGGIAHDFNNILTAVMGNLSLAQLDIGVDSPAATSLRAAEKAALRARDLTQQLLTFAKGGEPVRAAVQLEAIVREMTSFALHGSQVKAFYDMAPNLWPADADKGQIGRVVQNLVINAVQAMPNGGTLRIMARNDTHDDQSHPGLARGDYIQIAISDTGEGIKPEHLGRIFDPYFTTKQTGTGLGLAAVYSIVRKHSGHIDVESQMGQGTTFRFWLPALRQQLASVETRTPWDEPDRLKGRVLFMDDEQIIRDMAKVLLQRLGLTVDCAVDGADAVARYQKALAAGARYDLVIMDLTVPGGMGGLAAVGKLRTLDPTVRAVVSSGYSSDPVLANYKTHGFVAVIAKPYEMNELSNILRTVLAG